MTYKTLQNVHAILLSGITCHLFPFSLHPSILAAIVLAQPCQTHLYIRASVSYPCGLQDFPPDPCKAGSFQSHSASHPWPSPALPPSLLMFLGFLMIFTLLSLFSISPHFIPSMVLAMIWYHMVHLYMYYLSMLFHPPPKAGSLMKVGTLLSCSLLYLHCLQVPDTE